MPTSWKRMLLSFLGLEIIVPCPRGILFYMVWKHSWNLSTVWTNSLLRALGWPIARIGILNESLQCPKCLGKSLEKRRLLLVRSVLGPAKLLCIFWATFFAHTRKLDPFTNIILRGKRKGRIKKLNYKLASEVLQ